MSKTLEEAIGCWTVDPSGFRARLKLITYSVRTCKIYTEANEPPQRLFEELRLLRRRLESLDELVVAASARCHNIIENKELEQ